MVHVVELCIELVHFVNPTPSDPKVWCHFLVIMSNNNAAAENNNTNDEGPPCPFCQNAPCLLEQGLYDYLALFEEQFVNHNTCEPGELTNKVVRYNLYRQASHWIHGHLGKGVRKEFPQCVRTEILDMAPEKDGLYVGFREAAD